MYHSNGWMEKCQKHLDYVKQIITRNPIFVYPDLINNIALFTDSSEPSWGGILIYYHEQVKEEGKKVNVPHPISYQSSTFQDSQKNWSALTKEAYAIYMSFHKMVFYLKDAHVKIRCDHALLCKMYIQ